MCVVWRVCFERIFKIGQHLAKLRVKKVNCLKRPVHRGMKNSFQIQRITDRNCCKSKRLRLTDHTNPDKYQIGVLSTTFDSPTGDQTIIVCASTLLRRLSSWLLQLRTVRDSVGFRCDTVSIFSTVNKMTVNIIGWVFFSATASNARLLHGSLLHSSVEHNDFRV